MTLTEPIVAQQRVTRDADDDATRYLCAAAHIDERFARRAIAELLIDEHRAPAPSHGIDTVAVLRHCLAARGRRLHRDSAICLVIVIALLLALWQAVAWLVWLAGITTALRIVQHNTSARRLSASGVIAAFLGLVWVIAGLVALAMVTTDADPYGMRRAWHLPAPGCHSTLRWILVPFGAAACCWLIGLAERLATRHTLTHQLRRDSFDSRRWVSPEPGWAQHALAELVSRPATDRRVITEPDIPYAGSGGRILRRRWLVETGPSDFDTVDLLDRVSERLRVASGALDPSGRLNRLRCEDCAITTGPIHVTGRTADATLRLIPGTSATTRHYRRTTVIGDPADVITTAYLTATAGGGLLHIDLQGHAIPPVASRYRISDRMPPGGPGVVLAEALRAANDLPRRITHAPVGFARSLLEPLRRLHRRTVLDRAAQRGLRVAAGARTSLRELAAADLAAHPWAGDDAHLYLAVIERRLREELGPLLNTR
jgi:hypothetical protein